MQSPRAAEQAPAPPVNQAQPPRQPYLSGLPRHWHAVPDTVLDGADLVHLSVRGASLRGASHRTDGAARQDAMGIYPVAADGIEAVLGCVADGVDDEPLSHLGAEQACLILRDEVRARLPLLLSWQPGGSWQPNDVPGDTRDEIHQVCQDLVRSAADRFAGRASLLKVAPGALSATLAVALVETTGDDEGGHRWMTFTLGDCGVFLLDRSGLAGLYPNACLTCSAESGNLVLAGDDGYCPSCGREIVPGQTHFCPSCGREIVPGHTRFCPGCGREIVSGDTRLPPERSYVTWDLSRASPPAADVSAATFPGGSVGLGSVTVGRVPPGGGQALVICSGGLARAFGETGVWDQLASWWLAEPVPTLPEFASQLSFSSSSYTADRTAICFWGR